MTTPQDIESTKEKYLQYILERNDVWNELYVIPTIQGQSFYSDSQEPEFLKLSDMVRNNPRVVILGDPGSGKTTLLRFLEIQFAKNLLRNPNNSVLDNYGNDYGIPRLPIYLSAAILARTLAEKPRASFEELVLSGSENFQMIGKTLRKVLEIAIKKGEALILLDGLDEITDSSRRLEIRQKIEDFVAVSHAQTHLIMTSRILGYGSYPFPGGYSHYVIRELDRLQIETFLRNFLAQNKDVEMILKVIDENPAIGRLASNPLMLFMLLQITIQEGRLPSNRVQLYQSAIEIMLHRVEMLGERYANPFVDQRDSVDLFRFLAFWTYENKPNGLVSDMEIRRLLNEFLAAKNSTMDVTDLLEWIRQTGILIEFSPGNYGFAHLSFQEFFVATELIRQDRPVEDLFYQRRGDDRWLHPILLAIGVEKIQNPSRAAELLRAVIMPRYGGSEEYGTEYDYEKGYKEILDSYRVFAALQHEDRELREMAVKIHQINRDSSSKLEKKMPRQIFISYSHRDRAFVKKLADDLKKKGFSVWWDEWEINVGDSIVQKIEEGIKTSAFLAVVLSPDSVKSSWVRREVGSATMRQLSEKRSITVLPILVAQCEIPVLLGEIKYADFRSDYKSGLKDLLRTCA